LRAIRPRAGPTNAALPTRERLAQHEVEKLVEMVKRNRRGRRERS
jgi:hypothetical protein